jgi:4'-phosphopantetheinyl transferase
MAPMNRTHVAAKRRKCSPRLKPWEWSRKTDKPQRGERKFAMSILWLEQTEPDVPVDNLWLCEKETCRLTAMPIPKRRADWRLGRWTAKQAVAAVLNMPSRLANIEIRPAPSGAPEVFLDDHPADVAISLSHRDGTALCTAAPLGTTFGCDLELIEPRSDAFVADYFTIDEKALVEQASIVERPLLLALIWSGKESALKALRVGLRLATTCMCVRPDGWQQPSEERRQEWRTLQVSYSAGQMFAGWWCVQNNLVRTVVSDPPLPAPRRGAVHL